MLDLGVWDMRRGVEILYLNKPLRWQNFRYPPDAS
jgi:hypothetical protein